MGKYAGDQNQQSFFYESGTYATKSGNAVWIGEVQTFDGDQNPNVIPVRYQGATDRSVQQWVDGPLDYAGKATFYPQNWISLGFALGSIVDGGSPSPYTHAMRESNTGGGNAYTSGTTSPFLSFSWEDSKQQGVAGGNRVITYNGCMVDKYKLTGNEGGILQVELDFIAQNATFASGAASAITADSSRPYLWDDVQFHLPSGTVLNEVREFSLLVDNHVDTPHYLNGSRVIGLPTPLARDYTFEVKINNGNAWAKTLYDQYYIGGSEFNSLLWINKIGTTGSNDVGITMSGCKILKMPDPSKNEGMDEATITIRPRNIYGDVDDLILKYNPW